MLNGTFVRTTLRHVSCALVIVALLPGQVPAGEERNPRKVQPDIHGETGPVGDGENYRRWTPLLDAEVNAADPTYRKWARLIESGRADKRVMRLHHFYRTRLDPFDRPVPAGWRQRALRVLRDEAKTRAALHAFAARRGDSVAPPVGAIRASGDLLRGTEASATAAGTGISASGVWVPIGPFNIPGRMTGLDRPANDPETLYASAADGGVWRTRDGGASWVTLTDFEATLSGGSVLLDPTDPDIIYFGTGEGNNAIDNYPGIGVLKSTDGGQTWTESNEFSSYVRAMAMHASNTDRIYASGSGGLYVSTDAGATFSIIDTGGLPGNSNSSSAVLINPDNADIVYTALWGSPNGGIYRSTDGGVNWTFLSSGLPAQGSVGRIAMAISRSNPDVLIAGTDESGGKIYKTTDAGDNWNAATSGVTGYCGGQCWYDNVVGIDPADPDVLYAGGIRMWRSTDGGFNWSQLPSSGVHVDQHFILTPEPGEIIIANDGGINRSTNQGSSWSSWDNGMDTTQYYGICRHPSNAAWAMGGTQDNGSHRRDPNWVSVLGADGGMCMTGPPSGQVVIGEYQNHNMRRSTNNGDSFVSANGGIQGGEPRPWVGILVEDPTDRNNMWTSTHSVYRSLDARATNWVKVGASLHTECGIPQFPLACDTTALEVSPASSQRVYAGFQRRGIYMTDNALDGTVSWTAIDDDALQPNRTVRRLRAHPTELDTLYAVFSGFGSGKIWKTTDKGVSWTDVTGNLPDVPVNDVVIDGDNPGTVIAATDLGIYRTDDDGVSWYGWSIGYPTVASIEMTHDASSGTLRAGTHGRSMWEWQEASSSPTAVPDGNAVTGTAMTVERLGAADMRVRWDVVGCTAMDYGLFYGDLDLVSSYTYSGAECGLGTSGLADVPMPSTASGSAFFIVASRDASGNEGPHGRDGGTTVRPADGIGFCGITNQVTTASCP